MVIRNTSGCVLLVVTDSRAKAVATSSRKKIRIRQACIANQPSTVSTLRCRFPAGVPARRVTKAARIRLGTENEQPLAGTDDLLFDIGATTW
jgi:hypothetical protein